MSHPVTEHLSRIGLQVGSELKMFLKIERHFLVENVINTPTTTHGFARRETSLGLTNANQFIIIILFGCHLSKLNVVTH